MRLINPFRAVIPEADKASLVVSRDLNSYTPEELHAILEYNPYSFLHIINPGYRFDQHFSGEEKNTLVKNRYLEYRQSGILAKEQEPALYLYQQISSKINCFGIIGNLHLSHYRSKRVKVHEKTLKPRVEIFKDYLKTTRIQSDPVLLIHEDHEALDTLITEIARENPYLDFTTADKSHHKLWRINDQNLLSRIYDAFEELNTVYIADGHHRIASSYKLFQEEPSPQETGYVMSLYCSVSQITITGFTRMVMDLNGLSEKEFLVALDRCFIVEKLESAVLTPSRATEFTMYLQGHYYLLTLRNEFLTNDPLKDLPPNILQRTVLKPVLGVNSIRKSNRIVYDHHAQGELKMKELIDKGLYQVGFSHFPIGFKQLKEVADEGSKMPPKSTYIEPKLKSGLTLYEF